jgi:hypothetical protein
MMLNSRRDISYPFRPIGLTFAPLINYPFRPIGLTFAPLIGPVSFSCL